MYISRQENVPYVFVITSISDRMSTAECERHLKTFKIIVSENLYSSWPQDLYQLIFYLSDKYSIVRF